MQEYEEIYNQFEGALIKAKLLSQACTGIRSLTASHYYSSFIFTKLCVSAETTLRNCPAPSRIGKGDHWDCSSVATLARGIIETYLVFFYLCIEECSVDEWEVRWRVMNLHDHTSRYKYFLASNNKHEAEKFKKETKNVKADLEKLNYFINMPEKQQKKLLTGTTAFIYSKDEIVKSFGGDVDEFRACYRFLSNHTHTFPMSFYRMVESNRGCGVETETEVVYSGMFLSWAYQYLEKATEQFKHKWKDVLAVN